MAMPYDHSFKPIPLPPLGQIPQLLVAGDGVVVEGGGVVVRGSDGGPGGHEDIDVEDGGGDVADGFALGAAADEKDAAGFLVGGVFQGDHGIPHGVENSLDCGAGNVFAGGVGGQPRKTPVASGRLGVRSPSK